LTAHGFYFLFYKAKKSEFSFFMDKKKKNMHDAFSGKTVVVPTEHLKFFFWRRYK